MPKQPRPRPKLSRGRTHASVSKNVVHLVDLWKRSGKVLGQPYKTKRGAQKAAVKVALIKAGKWRSAP